MTTTAQKIQSEAHRLLTSLPSRRPLPARRRRLLRDVTIQKVSVDVFDTVATRPLGDPSTLLDFVGADLAARSMLRIPAHQFRVQRMAAERDLSRSQGGRDVPLRSVYEELSWREVVWVGPETAERVELEWNERLLCVLPGNPLRQLRQLTPSGIVHFLSDSPFHAEWLRERLAALGLLSDDDDLITSADASATKRKGSLFAQQLSITNVPPSAWVHCGNDEIGDVRMPARFGIGTAPHRPGNLTKRERQLQSLSETAGPIASVLAGSSRLARLEHAGPQRERDLNAVVNEIVGPTLATFVLWVLFQVRAQRYDRVCFVARDGEILHHLASALAPSVGVSDLDCRYLMGSRQAWNLPSFTSLDEHAWAWIFDDADHLTVRRLAARIGFGVDELRAAVPSSTWHCLTDDEEFGERHHLIVDPLTSSAGLWRSVAMRATGQRELMLDYLRHEGFGDDRTTAVVDLGWSGRMGRSLQLVLRSAGIEPPAMLYCGLRAASGTVGPQNASAFYFDGRRTPAPFPGELEFLEFACLASHGHTLGYKRVDSGVSPVLASPDPAVEAWGRKTVVDSLQVFGRVLAEALDVVGPVPWLSEAGLRAVARRTLPACRSLTPSEAAVWGDFPHSSQQISSDQQAIAPALTVREALQGSGGRWRDLRAARSCRAIQIAVGLRRRLAVVRHVVRSRPES